MGGSNTKIGQHFAHNTSGIDPLIVAWNNAVGFEQLTNQLTVSFEEFVSTLDDVTIIPYSSDLLNDYIKDPDSKLLFVLHVDYAEEESGGIISIARHMLYDPRYAEPIPLHMDLFEKYNILSGFVIIHTRLSIEDFATRVQREQELKRQYLVTFENKESDARELFFVVNSYYQKVSIGLSGNSQCLNWIINFRAQTASINSLFYDVDKSECYGSDKINGNWVLDFIDQLHSLLGVIECELTDASTFMVNNHQYSAACVYASTHNGLSWYMSHHYLLNKEWNISESLKATNKEIHDVVEWWNSQRDTTNEPAHICERYNDALTNMIKFYNYPMEIDIPKDKSLPARFRLATENPQQEEFEKSDRHFSGLFYRLIDVLHVLPGTVYEEIKDPEYYVVRPTGLKDNCQFNISDARNLILGTVSNRHDQTLSFLQNVAGQNVTLSRKFWEDVYFPTLFPILQSCHQRHKYKSKQKNDKNNSHLPMVMSAWTRENSNECHKFGVGCVSPAAFSISPQCGSYCDNHFYDTIPLFVEALQLVTISGNNTKNQPIEILLKFESCKITSTYNHPINFTNSQDIITFLQLLEPDHKLHLHFFYHHPIMVPSTITIISCYINNQEFEISVIPEIQRKFVVLDFVITSPTKSMLSNAVNFIQRKIR
jgi:hypothetical protein